jgi:hypothetical protein
MTKDAILQAIREAARETPNEPLGRGRFEKATGIKESDWRGRYWARWDDALEEAGLTRNVLDEAYPDEILLEKLLPLVRDHGRLPTVSELQLARRRDSAFPSDGAFRRLGSKREWRRKLAEFCRAEPTMADVLHILHAGIETDLAGGPEPKDSQADSHGEVYLLKSGQHFKIGRSNDAGIRGRELAIQLPDKSQIVHVIKTDDPAGIEAYWHRRFADRRKNGEWFELSSSDVKAFRRRRFQ